MAINLINQQLLDMRHAPAVYQEKEVCVQDWWAIPLRILIAFRFPDGKHVGTTVSHDSVSHDLKSSCILL